MGIFTAQYRYAGIDRVDITVKASHVLSPTWDMVMAYKKDYKNVVQNAIFMTSLEAELVIDLATCGYTQIYLPHIKRNIEHNSEAFRKFLEHANKYGLTLVCFCKAGDFCHRVLAAKYIEDNYNIPYMGERG